MPTAHALWSDDTYDCFLAFDEEQARNACTHTRRRAAPPRPGELVKDELQQSRDMGHMDVQPLLAWQVAVPADVLHCWVSLFRVVRVESLRTVRVRVCDEIAQKTPLQPLQEPFSPLLGEFVSSGTSLRTVRVRVCDEIARKTPLQPQPQYCNQYEYMYSNKPRKYLNTVRATKDTPSLIVNTRINITDIKDSLVYYNKSNTHSLGTIRTIRILQYIRTISVWRYLHRLNLPEPHICANFTVS